MADIINFPTKSKDWAIIELELKRQFAELDLNEPAQKRLLETMKSFHEFLDKTVALSLVIPEGPASRLEERINAAVTVPLQAMGKQLFLERLEREVQHCQEIGIWEPATGPAPTAS